MVVAFFRIPLATPWNRQKPENELTLSQPSWYRILLQEGFWTPESMIGVRAGAWLHLYGCCTQASPRRSGYSLGQEPSGISGTGPAFGPPALKGGAGGGGVGLGRGAGEGVGPGVGVVLGVVVPPELGCPADEPAPPIVVSPALRCA